MNQHEFIEKLNMQVNILILKQILCTDQCISRGLGGGGGNAGKGRGFEKNFDQIPQGGKRNISPTPREKNLNKQYYNTT